MLRGVKGKKMGETFSLNGKASSLISGAAKCRFRSERSNRDERKDLPIHSSVFTLPIKNSLIALFKPIHHHLTSFTVQVFEMIESRVGRCKCLLRIKGCSKKLFI